MVNRADHHRGRWSDRVIGVTLGLVLGIAIVVALVFFGGDETIDAPRLEQGPGMERTEDR